MIAIIDYGAGNIRSVANALERAGATYCLTASPADILAADHVILPGVGEAASAMARLRERGLDVLIPELRMPVLGICIGLQLLCRSSEEGGARCLGVFDTDVRRLPDAAADGTRLKVPHVGWNTARCLSGPLFDGLDEGREEVNRLLFRLVNYLQPHTIVEAGIPSASGLYLQAAHRAASYQRVSCLEELPPDGSGNIDFLYFNDYRNPEQTVTDFRLFLPRATTSSVCVLNGIGYTRSMRKLWKELQADAHVRVTFDLYDVGLLFFDPTKAKQHHIVCF